MATCISAANTHFWALFLTAWVSVQPVQTSVAVRVWQKSPRGSPPSWPTRSISANPGAASSHSAQVRIGIWDFSSEPGLVPDLPRTTSFARSPASRRSIVAADMAHSEAAVASWMSSSPHARSRATTENELTGSRPAQDSILLLIRIHSPETADPAALYEKVRKWWRMRRVQAERTVRVLAGFVGDVAADRARWVGASVTHLFKAGAANPVRYLPASALDPDSIAAIDARDGGLALLLRLNQSWHEAISARELYEVARGWWVLSPTNAERVVRVLAVAGGIVREVYEPTDWLPLPVPGLENRIGFNGAVAADRATYAGRDVSHLLRPGSANPVRYLQLAELIAHQASGSEVPTPPVVEPSRLDGLVEPGLLERVLPLLTAFEDDLLCAQSHAGQELFHSNTIAWLLSTHPQACAPLLDLLGGVTYGSVNQVDAWREKHNLDIVINPVGAKPRVVVENKLYSIPYPAQLTK